MALTGAVLGNQCFPSQGAAVDAYYSGAAPVITAGSTSYAIEFVKSGAVWQQKSYSIGTTGTWTLRSTTNAPVPTFPACDPSEKFLDGVQIGSLLSIALVAVAGITLLRRGVRGG